MQLEMVKPNFGNAQKHIRMNWQKPIRIYIQMQVRSQKYSCKKNTKQYFSCATTLCPIGLQITSIQWLEVSPE